MRNITGGIRLFKSRAQGSIERALNYPIEVAGAMQAIFGSQNLQNLSAALEQMQATPDPRHLYRGISRSELDAIRQTQRIGYGPHPAAGKDLDLGNPNHVYNNSSQLLHSATPDLPYAAAYTKLSCIAPGKGCILKFSAPVIVDQNLHFAIDSDVFRQWDQVQNNASSCSDDLPAKQVDSYDLISRTTEIDILTNTPDLTTETDFRPSVEDIVQITHLYVPGIILSFLPKLPNAEFEKVFQTEINPGCLPRTWQLSILNTGNTNGFSDAEFQRLMTLAHNKGLCNPEMRLLAIEDAASAFKAMNETFPRLQSYTPDHTFQQLSTVPKDMPLGHDDVVDYLLKTHETFKQENEEAAAPSLK